MFINWFYYQIIKREDLKHAFKENNYNENCVQVKKSSMWQLSRQNINRQTIGRHFFEKQGFQFEKKKQFLV